jgi:hypothetical protein
MVEAGRLGPAVGTDLGSDRVGRGVPEPRERVDDRGAAGASTASRWRATPLPRSVIVDSGAVPLTGQPTRLSCADRCGPSGCPIAAMSIVYMRSPSTRP